MSGPPRFLLVGLTGGIATWKSTVSELLRLDHVTGESIGVDDLAAELPEHLRDRALPRRDAAGEADEEKRSH